MKSKKNKMKVIKLISIFTITLGFLNQSSGQSNRILANGIEFSLFDVNSPRTKHQDSIEIFQYVKINPKGHLDIFIRNEDDNSLSFHKYQLDSMQIDAIDSVINDKIPLNEYMITKRLKKGEHYGGNYMFFSVSYQNKPSQSLSFIDSYVSEELNSVVKIIEDAVYKKIKEKSMKPFNIPTSFLTAINLSYKESNYLPPIEFPPPPM